MRSHEDIPMRVVLLDDEIEACENLKNIFKKYVPYPIDIIGIFHHTRDLEAQLDQLKPDAVFIDIEMPDENAFQFLQRLPDIDFEIIFVTAYDEYALKAFKINALDYILKPISIEELNSAVEKLQIKLSHERILNDPAFFSNLSKNFREKNTDQTIHLRTHNSLEIILQRHIYSIEAKGNYSIISYVHQGVDKSVMISNPISYYEDILPTECFFRIHKSFLINCMYLKRIVLDPLSVIVNEKYHYPISRRRYSLLLQFLKEQEHTISFHS